jgi:hypothetical protein
MCRFFFFFLSVPCGVRSTLQIRTPKVRYSVRVTGMIQTCRSTGSVKPRTAPWKNEDEIGWKMAASVLFCGFGIDKDWNTRSKTTATTATATTEYWQLATGGWFAPCRDAELYLAEAVHGSPQSVLVPHRIPNGAVLCYKYSVQVHTLE